MAALALLAGVGISVGMELALPCIGGDRSAIRCVRPLGFFRLGGRVGFLEGLVGDIVGLCGRPDW